MLFCALSSAGYLLNDVRNVDADRAHPIKRFRPIASGRLPVSVALAVGFALAIGGVELVVWLARPHWIEQ